MFIYLLAHSDADGSVCQPRAAIAAKTGLPAERVGEAITLLESADAASGTAEYDGARLVRTIPARDEWTIVNYLKYRGMRDEEERRRQVREAKARHLARKVSQGKPQVSHGKPQEAQAEEEDRRQKIEVSRTLSPASPNGSAWRARFDGFWTLWPKKQAKKAAFKAWGRIPGDAALYDAIAEGVRKGLETDQWRRGIIPHAATWLNGERWKDSEQPTVERESEDETMARLRREGILR